MCVCVAVYGWLPGYIFNGWQHHLLYRRLQLLKPAGNIDHIPGCAHFTTCKFKVAATMIVVE